MDYLVLPFGGVETHSILKSEGSNSNILYQQSPHVIEIIEINEYSIQGPYLKDDLWYF